MKPPGVVRMLLATVTLAAMLLVLSGLHDYSQTRRQLDLIRYGDVIATERPWIVMFYFLNEAGSGIKFFLTGDKKHMRSFPTDVHRYNKQLARARNNDWMAQMRVAHRYYLGTGVEQNGEISLYWLRQAAQNAPPEARAEIAALIEQVEATPVAADI